MNRSRSSRVLVVALFAAAAACAAPDADQGPMRQAQDVPGPAVPAPTNTPAPAEPAPAPSSTPLTKPPIVIDSNVTPTRPAYQAKSSSQLAATINNCVGSGATTITAAMILGGAPSPGGFLNAPFAAGQDMVSTQAALFDGNIESLRTSIRVDQMTLEYLTALRNAGNVVGYNCLVGTVADPSLCKCDTFPTAYAMLSRCLGSVADPTTADFITLAADFQTACTTSRGTAIASLVASSAFAKLP